MTYAMSMLRTIVLCTKELLIVEATNQDVQPDSIDSCASQRVGALST